MTADSDRRVRRAMEGDSALVVTRAFTLDDIHVRTAAQGGDGRTVDAYAAVFLTPTEIVDQDGHYREQIDPHAFDKSIKERRGQIFSVYNHAKTLAGTPSGEWSVPVGKPLEIRSDAKGLFTSTRYNDDPASERILEAIKSGSLTGMSFTGVFLRSVPDLKGPYDQYWPDADGVLPLVTRMEIALIEYGATPIPAYDTATVVGVRARRVTDSQGNTYVLPRESVRLVPVPPHKTKTLDTKPYDANAAVHKLSAFGMPAQPQMMSIYAMVDETQSNDDGTMPTSAGYLPHHEVDTAGNVGPANMDAVRQSLADLQQGKLDGLGYGDDHKQVMVDHLQGHVNDHASGGAEAADEVDVTPSDASAHYSNATNSDTTIKQQGAPVSISSSGRNPDGTERAVDLTDTEAETITEEEHDRANKPTHAPIHGTHTHVHEAHGDDGGADDEHEHEHSHAGDNNHDHTHQNQPEQPEHEAGTSQIPTLSSGRQPEGSERADNKGWVMRDGKWCFDPDNDGDDDSSAATDKDHDYWSADGKQLKAIPPDPTGKGGKPLPGRPLPKGTTAGSAGRQPEGSERAWNGPAAMSKALHASDPAKAFSSICAGKRDGDPKLEATWALPHHDSPGGPPNPDGVRAALGRFGQTQGLTNKSAAQSHLEAHARALGIGDHGKSGDNGSTSSSGRTPAANATPRGAGGTGQATGKHGPHPHPAGNGSPRRGDMEGDGRMTVEERMQRQQAVHSRLGEIDTEFMGQELTPEARTEWNGLQEELLVHDRAIKDASARRAYLQTIAEKDPNSIAHTEGIDPAMAGYGDASRFQYAEGSGVSYGGDNGVTGAGYVPPALRNGGSQFAQRMGRSGPAFNNPPENIYDLTSIRNRARSWDEIPQLMKEYAYRAVDAGRFPNRTKSREDCQETCATLLERIDDRDGTLARRFLTTGSPLYDRAFGKALQMQTVNGLTTEESRALQLGVDTYGGYAVPFQLDPTIILTSNGVVNPLRQIARVEQITGKEWDGVTSAGVTVTRVAEGTEAGTGDPSLVQPKVRTTRVQGFVPFNIELDVSWGALRSQMTDLLMDAKDVEEASSFILGNGISPQAGGLLNTMATTSIVFTAGTATLAIADLYSVENSMAPRFRQQSSYLASKTTFNRFRQLFQALASAAFDSWVRPSAGTPATFNGYPAYEQSQMVGTITSGSEVLVQGDFSQYLIVDRVGMGIELIPHLFGATHQYPLGQRGILAIWFNNGVILNANGFRVLQTT